jgi:hypothetical protein
MNKNIKDIIADELDAARDEELYNRLAELDRITDSMPVQCHSPSQRLAIGSFCCDLAQGSNKWGANVDEQSVLHGLLYGFQLGHDYVKRFGPIW